jgi:hypothetical protein
MPPQININELYSIQKKKKQKRTICFDKILELCHNRIRTIAESNGQNTFYEIPGILAGYPLYDLNECLEYIVDALRKNGFLVQILPKPHVAVIYISWDPEELKPPKPMKFVRPRLQASDQYRQLLPSYDSSPLMNKHTDTQNPSQILLAKQLEYSTSDDPSLTLPRPLPAPIAIPNVINKNGNKNNGQSGNNRMQLPSQNTRPKQQEPMYLASLRLF